MTTSTSEAGPAATVNIGRILEMLPHRYPMMLVDRLLDVRPGESAVGLKNATFNEPHFQGHFPGHPVMPGVLIIESMAQTAAALVVGTIGEEAEGKLVYFMTIENARFRRPVVPGDQMRIQVYKERSRGAVWKFRGEVTVDGTVAAEAVFSAMIRDR